MTIEFDELEQPNLARLRGRLDCLEYIVEALLLHMPEKTLEIIAEDIRDFSRETETDARETGSDLRRDYAEGVYSIASPLRDTIYQQIDELQSGARISLVQGAAIPKNFYLSEEDD